MTPKLTEEELAQLTDEEREGYLEEIEEGEGEEGAEETGGEEETTGEADGEADAGDDEGEGAEAETEKVEEKPAAVVEPDAKPAAAVVAEEPAPVVEEAAAEEYDPNDRTPRWILPADHQQQMEDIKAKRVEIVKQFDQGELTGEEMRAALDPLDDQYNELHSRQIIARGAREDAIETWTTKDVPGFFDKHEQYKKSGILREALDAEVKRLQATARNPLNPRLLEKAHEKIASELGGAFGTPAPKTPAPAPKPGAKPAEAGKPEKKREAPPPTLAHVPAADPTETDDGGEFAHLDRLLNKNDSVGYEEALRKLPDSARERYLAQ